MARTSKSRKAPGFECWSRRPFNRCGQTPGAFAKHRTHKAERAQGRLAAAAALALFLTGCAAAPKVEVPKVVKEVVVTYAPIPEALTEQCVVPPKRDNTVGEALRVARDRRKCNEIDSADKRAIRKISDKAVQL